MTQSEKNMVIESFVNGRESALIEQYIDLGPEAMKKEMGLSEDVFKVMFDHLVFAHNLLYKTVMANTEFFLESYVNFGMTHVREILNVLDDKYDKIFEVVFDYLVISFEGLKHHVVNHRSRYMAAMKEHGSDFVRKVLGVWDSKYDENWREVLELLLNGVCEDIFDERNAEANIKAFSLLMNQKREHRRII